MSLTAQADLPAKERVSRWVNAHRKWLFAAPAMIFTAILIGFPIGWTIYLSLTDAKGSVRRPADFIGIENYIEVLGDVDRFWPAVLRTGVFTFGALAVELVAGMLIALLLWRPFKAQRWVRVAILLPFVATPVAIAMMWRLIFEPNIGFANQFLSWFGIPPQPWFSEPATTLPTLIFVDIWEFTPMIAIILLAGLTSLSDEPDEAARIDGANAWQRFWFVTLPLLRPVVLVAILLRSIDALKTFDLLYVVKGQGGGSFHEAETLNIYVYGLSFQYNDFGTASAVLIIFFLMILLIMWLLTFRGKGAKL
ncbi:carbohydrate ABC transporter membrane protein 1, CUT1 family [Paramicrobacterium humi]|uniref:Carbohydrate ABC transporter membrane protein 1, CUT1 family n=1 Tax=Paramicrobacterium humi TaxID=640635 RepID=A0A1H4JI04_9MICO|nr:sugar ABC transporter permease [Microbacterium humi]SEB45959.1 carbohydrate ABC transporter membrane protein 1, CUT1 family [Microbacterium humi]